MPIIKNFCLQLQFQYPQFLWLFAVLALLALLFFAVIRWKKKVARRIGEARLVQQLTRNFSNKLFAARFIVFSLAFAVGIIGAANLRSPGGADNISRKGIDVVIALDVSKSMLATDIQPSRLERAKQTILNLMDRMPNDRVGLVLFAGKAYLQMPLTADHGAAAIFVSSASPDAVPSQGTVLSEALDMSSRAFNTKEGRFKSVILVSDGEDHDEEAMKTAADLAQQGVMVCTVGIGSAEGAQIPDPATQDFKKDAEGNVVVSKLNEEELKAIAEKTNGIYVHFENSANTVDALLGQLSQVEKKTFNDVSLLNFKTYYLWFAAAMFLLLIIEQVMPERKMKIA